MQLKKTKVTALDLSTRTGLSVLSSLSGEIVVNKAILIEMSPRIDKYPAKYPLNYIMAVRALVSDISRHIERGSEVVIEETNLGKQRYSQKILEFIHFHMIEKLLEMGCGVSYISTSQWRSSLGVRLSKDDSKNNKTLAKAKRENVDKRELGIAGKITTKHLSVRYVNARFNTTYILKDNDITDSICLGTAFLEGAPLCTGKER